MKIIKKAVCFAGRAAKQNEPYRKSYLKAALLSILKEQVGELLLYLQTPLPQNEQQNYWQVFESCLRQYIDLRFCEGFYE